MRRIKIVSDGTRRGTTVSDADTGEVIERVLKVEYDLDGERGYAVARLTIMDPVIDLTSAVTEETIIR